MHRVIFALVEAGDFDEALSSGKKVFERLIETDRAPHATLDYFVTFDHEGTNAAGKARWGNLPTAASVQSNNGRQLLERSWDATKEQFEVHTETNSHQPTEQQESPDEPMPILYDEDANGIYRQADFDRVIERGDDLWIVPADVHY